MSAENTTNARRPWRATIALGIVALLLAVGLVGLLVQRASASTGLGLSSQENQVLDAAKQGYVTLQTFRLNSFDKDFSNALGVVSGSAKTNLQDSKASLQSTLKTNKTNVTASITSASIASQADGKYQVLILASLQNLNTAGKIVQTRPSPALLTMVHEQNLWLIDAVNLVEVTS